MRRKLSVAILVVLMLAMMIFAVACVDRDSDGLIKLSSPKNLALNGSTLSWDSVPNASEYYISVNGEEKAKTSNTTYDLAGIVSGYGNFNITVRAYGDGKKYGTSDQSQVFVYRKGNALDTPVIIIDKESKIASWQSVENCVKYVVNVYDGENLLLDTQESTDTSYNFAEKTYKDGKLLYEDYDKYKITVVAKADETKPQFSDSLTATAYYINSKVLDTPSLLSMNNLIKWSSVENVKNYTIRLTYEDGTYQEFNTTGTTYQRSKFKFEKAGKYYFSVKANGDDEVYLSSEFSKESEDYKITKLEPLNPENVKLTYDEKGIATLEWKINADSLANNFNLSLKALLANGEDELESSKTSTTISNVVNYAIGEVYDVYDYVSSDVVSPQGSTMLVYNFEGYLKIQKDSVDYFVYDTKGEKVMYEDFTPSASIDIVYKASNEEDKRYVLEPCDYNNPDDGSLVKQSTGEEKEVLGSDGKQLYFFETEENLDITKTLEYDSEGNVINHVFAIKLDSMFIKKIVSENEEGETVTTYEKVINDDSYYGILYNISVATGNSSIKFEFGENVSPEGQYLSYMIPTKNEFGWYITSAGEYAYMVINSFANPQNTDSYNLQNNIDFGGYEFVNIKDFYGKIVGGNHTVANMVLSNKRLTENGVVEVNDSADVLNYSLFTNLNKGSAINNVFYVGLGVNKLDMEKLNEEVKTINVASLAMNNYGNISHVFVQSDLIDMPCANIAGLVMNNYSYIDYAQVYAEIKGRNVAGLVYTNYTKSADSIASVLNSGFYGTIEASIGEYINEGIESLYGAGLVIENKANEGMQALVSNSFAFGDVIVTADGLNGVYSGGLVAVNSSVVSKCFAGEFTLNNIYDEITANGDNGYAGGLIAYNKGTVSDCYATGKASASLYSGGFIGLNEGTISSCYATGNTTVGGANKGAFAGLSSGTIQNVASYSTDTWAKDKYGTLITTSGELSTIINILYPETEAQMAMAESKGYRNPLLKGMIYTKDFKVGMIPAVSDKVASGIMINNSNEIVDITGDGDNIFGNTSKKGNKVVVALTEGSSTRYIYGYIK